MKELSYISLALAHQQTTILKNSFAPGADRGVNSGSLATGSSRQQVRPCRLSPDSTDFCGAERQ
jgi:hypothetical protein